jgi:ABC-type iron transport system FetAB permease component
MLSVLLRFTDSDFPFGILKLFLNALRFILVWFVLLRGIGLTPPRNYAYSGQEAIFPLVIRVFVVSYIYIVDSYSLTSCKRLLFYT